MGGEVTFQKNDTTRAIERVMQILRRRRIGETGRSHDEARGDGGER
jgi:hypothetical protein